MNAIIQWFPQHLLALFAFLIIVFIFYWLLKFQKRLNIMWKEALLIAVLHVIIGYPCMKLFAILEVGGNMEKAANMRLYGAIFVLPFMYYLWAKITKRDPALILDISSVCLIIGAISGRLNCFTTGCCNGYAMDFNGMYHWPIREAELLFYAIFLVIFVYRILKEKTHGEVYPIYLISYGVLRFLCEFVREEFTTQIGIFHLAHIWSMISIVSGLIALIIVKKKYSLKRQKKG